MAAHDAPVRAGLEQLRRRAADGIRVGCYLASRYSCSSQSGGGGGCFGFGPKARAVSR